MAMTYDIHVAADVLSSELERLLLTEGYRRDDFRPGDRDVVRAYHFVKHPTSMAGLERSWKRLMIVLGEHEPGGFRGFAEAERSPSRLCATFPFRQFDERVTFPLEPVESQTCPLSVHKAFDVHIVAGLASFDPRLDRILVEAGFYVVDIRKASGETRRCFTIQPLDLHEAPKVFGALETYLTRAGGFEGKLKLEFAHALVRFPRDATVPPVVAKLSYRE